MLIFYIEKSSDITFPVVIIDALSSDDRFTMKQINAAIKENAPSHSGVISEMFANPQIFSCEYSMQFSHTGIPLGQGMTTRFSGMLKSPPGILVTAFSPSYLTSSQSMNKMMDALDKIINPQTNITYAAMVIQSAGGRLISRQFIVYAAPLYPDPYGTTTTMILSGAMVNDILLKSEVAVQIDKKSPLATQITALLAKQNPPMIGNYAKAPQALGLPATEILFQPTTLNNLLSEICLQNKMVFAIEGQEVTFNAVGQAGAPLVLGDNWPKFSFLGSAGFLAWGLGVENYANVKFKSAIFDCKLFGKISLYNDIKSAFFAGMMKRPLSKIDIYDFWIIRYSIKWSRDESICEVTATNNWLMAQFRIDTLLDTKVYSAAVAKL